MDKKRIPLLIALALAALLLLVAGTLALAAGGIFRVENNIPSSDVTISGSDETQPGTAGDSQPDPVPTDPAQPQDPEEETQQPSSEAPTGETTEPTEAPDPDITVWDQNKKYWRYQTDVELFRAEYENETGEISVRSVYGDKVIAPGTANSYDFYIRNTGNITLNYTVSAAAQVQVQSGGETYTVPLQVRFLNRKGNYVLGAEDTWAPITELESFMTHGTLSEDRYTKYTFQWQWPFEGNDDLDTLIGNLSSEGDGVYISLTLNVFAAEPDDPNAEGGLPNTGDQMNLALPIGLMVLSAACMLVLLLYKKEKKDAEAA